MKKILLVPLLTGAVWYAVMSAHDSNQLQLIDSNLTTAEGDIPAHRWKDADGLLVQADLDLRNVDDQVYTWPPVRQTRLRLIAREQELHMQLVQQVNEINKTLQSVMTLLGAGDVQGARDAAQASLQQLGGQDPALAATAQYVQALSAQDFNKAGQIATTIPGTLPGELDVAEIGKAMTGFVDSARTANHDMQQRIATELQPLVKPSATQSSASFSPVLKGRAMIWDFTSNAPDATYDLLPSDLRASPQDGTITMFLVTKRDNVEQGRYSISNQPAYQEKVTITVVYWPDKDSPGSVVIWGDPPPASRPVRYAPEYGTAVNIKNWITSLPRE